MSNKDYIKYIYSLSLQECKQLGDYLAGDDTALFSTRISKNSIPSDNEEINKFGKILRQRIDILSKFKKDAYDAQINQKYFIAKKNYKKYFNSLGKTAPRDDAMQSSYNECLKQVRKITLLRSFLILFISSSLTTLYIIYDSSDKENVVKFKQSLIDKDIQSTINIYEELFFKFKYNELFDQKNKLADYVDRKNMLIEKIAFLEDQNPVLHLQFFNKIDLIDKKLDLAESRAELGKSERIIENQINNFINLNKEWFKLKQEIDDSDKRIEIYCADEYESFSAAANKMDSIILNNYNESEKYLNTLRDKFKRLLGLFEVRKKIVDELQSNQKKLIRKYDDLQSYEFGPDAKDKAGFDLLSDPQINAWVNEYDEKMYLIENSLITMTGLESSLEHAYHLDSLLNDIKDRALSFIDKPSHDSRERYLKARAELYTEQFEEFFPELTDSLKKTEQKADELINDPKNASNAKEYYDKAYDDLVQLKKSVDIKIVQKKEADKWRDLVIQSVLYLDNDMKDKFPSEFKAMTQNDILARQAYKDRAYDKSSEYYKSLKYNLEIFEKDMNKFNDLEEKIMMKKNSMPFNWKDYNKDDYGRLIKVEEESRNQNFKIKTRIGYLEAAIEIIGKFEKNEGVIEEHNRQKRRLDNILSNTDSNTKDILYQYTNLKILIEESNIKDISGIKAIMKAENILRYKTYIIQLDNLKKRIINTARLKKNRLTNDQKEEFYLELSNIESRADKEVINIAVKEVKMAIENTDDFLESSIKSVGEGLRNFFGPSR